MVEAKKALNRLVSSRHPTNFHLHVSHTDSFNPSQLFAGAEQFHNHLPLDTPVVGAHDQSSFEHFAPPPSGLSAEDHPTYHSIDDLVNGIRPDSSHPTLHHDQGFSDHVGDLGALAGHNGDSLSENYGGQRNGRPSINTGSSEFFNDSQNGLAGGQFPQNEYQSGFQQPIYAANSAFGTSTNGSTRPLLSGAEVYDVHQHLPVISSVSPRPNNNGNTSTSQRSAIPLPSQASPNLQTPSTVSRRVRDLTSGMSTSPKSTKKSSKRRKSILEGDAEVHNDGDKPSKRKRLVHGPWKEEEGERLKELSDESKGKNPKLPPDEVDWDYVVERFGNGRSRHQILIKAVYLGIRPTTTHSSRLVRQKQYRGREFDISGLSEEKRAQYMAERDVEERARLARLHQNGNEYDEEGDEHDELEDSNGEPFNHTGRLEDGRKTSKNSIYNSNQHERLIRTAMDPSYLPAASNVRGSSESST